MIDPARYAWIALALGFAACVADVAITRWRWRRVAETMRATAMRWRVEWRRD